MSKTEAKAKDGAVGVDRGIQGESIEWERAEDRHWAKIFSTSMGQVDEKEPGEENKIDPTRVAQAEGYSLFSTSEG